MYSSYYSAPDFVGRLKKYEPPYNSIIEPGLYALEEVMTVLLQSDEPDFEEATTATRVLEAQMVFWRACTNDWLFVHCVNQRLLDRRMTDDQIRDDLGRGFAVFLPNYVQNKTMLANEVDAAESELLRAIAPSLLDSEVLFLTRMRLIDAIYAQPKIVLNCVQWPRWLFKKTK